MQKVTTKAMAKVAAVATGLAMATSMLSLAPIAHAAALTSAQVQAIISLLQSFGADAATIANVQASLTGGTVTPAPTGGACPALSRSLQQGSSGSDVMALQVFLNGYSADTRVSISGAGSPGSETTFFGPATRAAVVKFQAKNNVSPIGIVGPQTRAAIAAVCGGVVVTPPGTTPPPVTGTGLKVMLAADSPNGVALVAGQAAAELGKFTFQNPTAAPINVTSLTFNRIGVSNDSTMTNVYLYSDVVRLTDAAGVSNSVFNFNDPSGLFSVPAGGTFNVSVRSDIAGSTSGQQIGVKLVSVASSGTLDASVSLPITGGLQTISAATMATVDFNATTLPSATAVDPQADYVVWQNTTTIGTRAVLLKSFQLRNIGSIQSGDVINFRLYIDGVQVGQQITKLDANNKITFDLSANPVRIETGGRVIKVLADVVGGASRTFQMSLRQAADGLFVDTDLNQPVLATAASATFSARSATSATINSVTTSAPSVTRSADSPTAAVARGASNVKWASFKMVASGEDVKVDNLNVTADTSSSGSGLDNGKVFVNGVQVGSTKDLAEFGGTTTNFTFGSSFIAKVGQTTTVDIYADAKTSSAGDLTAAETVKIYLGVGSSNAQGQVSLNSINVPASEVTGNSLTITASALTAAKATGYGNQTVIAGAQNVKIGSFTLSAGSTEGVNVNTIELDFVAAVSSTISDMVVKNAATGAQFGAAKATVADPSSFTGSVNIPASGTVTFDVYANVKTGANAGAISAMSVSTNTTGTGSVTGTSVSVGTAATLQTITVGSATLTVTQNSGSTPDNANIVAGTSKVKVGSFRFTTQYSPYTVDQVKVKVLADAATAVTSVILEYKDANGATQSATQGLSASSGSQTHATATFSGLTFFVPADTNRDLDVFVSVPTVASVGSALSGKSITAILDANEGFNATDSSGTADTSLAATDVASSDTTGKGTLVVRKSIPTLAAGTAPNAILAAGTDQVLGRFNVTADAAGDVDWGQVLFTVTKSANLTIGATTTVAVWDVTGGGSTQVTGTFATTTGSTATMAQSFTSTASTGDTSGTLHFRPTTVQTVSAGMPRNYELRGTVGGIASGANNLSISIATPSTSATTAVFSTVAGTLGTSGNASFVWSDWSDTTDHAGSATGASTLDWTNDYLVKTLPLTIGTRSVNF